jgi:hypothetical protein
MEKLLDAQKTPRDEMILYAHLCILLCVCVCVCVWHTWLAFSFSRTLSTYIQLAHSRKKKKDLERLEKVLDCFGYLWLVVVFCIHERFFLYLYYYYYFTIYTFSRAITTNECFCWRFYWTCVCVPLDTFSRTNKSVCWLCLTCPSIIYITIRFNRINVLSSHFAFKFLADSHGPKK